MNTKANKGFTLIELMIVVAIIGVIASIAIPGFIRYVAQSKTSEVGLNLKHMMDGASAYYQVDHYDSVGQPVNEKHFPTQDGTSTGPQVTSHPANTPQGTKHPVEPTVWNNEPWRSLHFNIAKPHYFRYQYTSTPANDECLGQAFGDLDGDTTNSTYSIRANGDEKGRITITPVFVLDTTLDLE